MATSSMVPYSNRVGNNQTTPTAEAPKMGIAGAVPITTPLSPTAAATANPFTPATASPATAAPATATSVVPSASGTSAVANPGQAALDNPELLSQLNDIYGATGTGLFNLLQGVGGVNSQTLQDYIASLQPQMATADANLRASLGAGGVSANSSVAALGEANLQAQEQAAISGESAKLLQSGQNLETQILEGIAPAAEQQVADSSGWNVFGQVVQGIGGLVGDFMGLGGITGGIGSLVKGFGGAGGTAQSVPMSNFNSDFAVPGGGLGTL